MNIKNCKRLIYNLLIILLIMSIICYFVNLESFSGNIKKRRNQRLSKKKPLGKLSKKKPSGKLSKKKPSGKLSKKKSLGKLSDELVQYVHIPVKAIRFTKSTQRDRPFDSSNITDLVITTNNGKLNEPITPVTDYSNFMTTIIYSFTTDKIIKNISFSFIKTTPGTDSVTNYTADPLMMQFMDSSNNIVNEIILPHTDKLPVQDKFDFTFPPYTEIITETETEKYTKIVTDLQITSDTKTNAINLTNALNEEKKLAERLTLARTNRDTTQIIDQIREQLKTAETTLYTTAQTAINHALGQVRIAINKLKDGLLYSIYIINNEYVSITYINLIKEQQKKTLILALEYPKNPRKILNDLLTQTQQIKEKEPVSNYAPPILRELRILLEQARNVILELDALIKTSNTILIALIK